MEELRSEEMEKVLEELEGEEDTKENEARQHLQQAHAHEHRDEFEEALRECDLVLQLDPQSAEAHNLRGIVLEELGRKQEAVVAYREAVHLDPALQDAHQNLQELAAEMVAAPQVSVLTDGKRFGIRAGAYIIDTVVYFILTNIATFAIGVALGLVLALSGRLFYVDEGTNCLSYLVALVLSALYFAVFEWLYGATPGKLVLGMRVVMETGNPCTLGAALIRAALRYVDGFLFGLPAYSTMKPPLYQRIGDKSAKTMVVGSRDPVIRQPRAWWWLLVALAIYLVIDGIVSLLLIVPMVHLGAP